MNIDQLQQFCLSLPHVTEDVKWENDLCFCIGKKMFCVTHLAGDFGVSLKVKDETFEELVQTDDIIPAPYLARYKWIFVQDADRFSRQEWEKLITASYHLIKSRLPKKVLDQLENSI